MRVLESRVPKRNICALAIASLAAIATMLTMSPRAIAEPAVSTPLDDVSSFQWNGIQNTSLGGMNGKPIVSAGDVNGDGSGDLAVPNAGSSSQRGVMVLFTPEKLAGSIGASGLAPSHGYRIVTTSSSPLISNVGDQNADGTPDLLVQRTSSAFYLVYGISDPSSLPECTVGQELRCLDLASMDPSQGYQIQSGSSGDDFGDAFSGIGDANADGKPDILIGAPGDADDTGAVYVLYGGFDPPTGGAPLTVSDLPSSQYLKIDGPAQGAKFGSYVGRAGDINSDGMDDFSVFSPFTIEEYPVAIYVFDSSELAATSPMATSSFGPDEGFRIEMPPLTLPQVVSTDGVGDVNGDGTDDIAITGGTFTGTTVASIVYGSFPGPEDPISGPDPGVDSGYTFSPGEEVPVLFSGATNVGDLNGDDVPDQVFGAPLTPIGGSATGVANLTLGQRPTPSEVVTLGTELTPDVGVALRGSEPGEGAGQSSVGAGDLDNDGLADVWVAAPKASPGGLSSAGSVFLVLGKSLVGQAATGLASDVTVDSVRLGGTAAPNGRASTAYFEWGPDESYGHSTDSVDVGDRNGVVFTEGVVSDLDESATYHYRLVVKNDLGLKSYGMDRTFKTGAKAPKRCTADNTLPGCRGYNGEKFCKDYPADPKCQPEVTEARLSKLIANSRPGKVRRGGKAVVWAWITNTGNKTAGGVKVCATKVPKRLAKVIGKRCRKIGSLAPGKTGKAKFKVKVKRKARKRAKVKVKLVASAKGVGNNRTAKVRFAVR